MQILSRSQKTCGKWMKFHNFTDAANQLSIKLTENTNYTDQFLVLGVGEYGFQLAQLIAKNLKLNVNKIQVTTTKDEYGYQSDPIILLPELTANQLLVCDIGVETGKVARMIASNLAESAKLAIASFAAPIIPKEAEAMLKLQYQNVISVRNPLTRRALHWEYELFS
jgi:predicted phosphoribosyltransferase